MAQVDEFTRDAREWRMAAEHSFQAAVLLFNVNNPFLWFSAAMLGHHAPGNAAEVSSNSSGLSRAGGW